MNYYTPIEQIRTCSARESYAARQVYPSQLPLSIYDIVQITIVCLYIRRLYHPH